MRILVVEDEFLIAKALRDALEREGYEVAVAATGAEARELIRAWAPEVILLDLILPDLDGRLLAGEVRASSEAAVIMVTARGEEAERIAGLEMGADDYVVKPFSVPELVARVRAVTRRAHRGRPPARVLTSGELTCDVGEHRAFVAGRPLRLTRREFEILRMLMERPGRLVTRSELARAIWGTSPARAGPSLDVHVSAIRRKLGDDPRAPRYLETVRGIGFRLIEASARAQPPTDARTG